MNSSNSKDLEKYLEAKEWAKHFIKRVDAMVARYNSDDYVKEYWNVSTSVPERAAVKRTSMDLSRALVKVRKSNDQ